MCLLQLMYGSNATRKLVWLQKMLTITSSGLHPSSSSEGWLPCEYM